MSDIEEKMKELQKQGEERGKMLFELSVKNAYYIETMYSVLIELKTDIPTFQEWLNKYKEKYPIAFKEIKISEKDIRRYMLKMGKRMI